MFIVKCVGALAGAVISIIYLLPTGRREAILRLCIGFGVGLIFGSATGLTIADYLGIDDRLSQVEVALSGSAAASLCAWWALGLLARLSKHPTD